MCEKFSCHQLVAILKQQREAQITKDRFLPYKTNQL